MYPETFIAPESLGEWLAAKKCTHEEAAEHFGFQKITITKYAKHPTRDIGVWGDKICETEELEVLSLHIDGRMVDFPNPLKIRPKSIPDATKCLLGTTVNPSSKKV